MTDKKYIINVGDQSEIWDSDMFNEKGDALFSKYKDASVWEMENVEGFDEDPSNHEYMITVGDQSEFWDANMVREKGEKLKTAYPDAQIQRVSYKDYWGEQAEVNRAKRAELLKPNEERNAKLAEIGYYDDITGGQVDFSLDAPSTIGLKPLSSAVEESATGETTYHDPRVKEFFANDTAETERQAEIARLDAEYDANPSVIAQREWEAKMLEERKAYAGKLEQQILKDKQENVDEYHAGLGAVAKHAQDPYGANQVTQAIRMIKGEDVSKDLVELQKQERYDSALKFLQKAKIARDVAGKGFWGATIDWAKEGIMDVGTQSDIETYNEIGDILTRLEKELGNLKEENLTEEVFDKYLTKDEQALIKSFYEYNSAMAEAQQDMSRAYKGGKIFAESVPFMLEFLATGGAYKAAGRAATSWMGKHFANWIAKSASKKVAKAATKAITGAVKGAIGTAARTVAAPGTYKRMAEASIEIDKNGHLNRAKNSAVAFADMYVENLSEISGGIIGETLGLLGKGAGWLIGKTPLSKIGGMLGDNVFMQGLSKFGNGVKAFMPKLEALGFHGLPEEIGEEFIGNTIRELTGIQPGALKEMVSDDNFGAMLIGFAPMTLLGVAGGVYNLGVVNAKAAQLGKDLREKFGSAYTEEELDHMMGVIQNAQTAEEIQKALKPMAIAAVNSFEKGMITKEQMTEQIEMLYQYGGFMAQNNALLFGKKAQDKQMMDAKREEYTARLGRFWQEDQTETVQVATLNNGSTVFVTSAPAEDGKIAIVDAVTGKKGFANVSDIATREVDGEQIQSSNSMTMDAFLNGQIAMQRKTAEETRMNNERDAQIDALRAQITPGTKINLGTEGSPVIVYARGTNKRGVVIVDETGMESTLGWEQAAYALGQPIKVETDQQKLDAEISERLQRMAERRMRRAVTPATEATAEAADEAAEVVAQEQQNIPLREDGTVDEALFWTQDPEGYVKWNDEQNKDGGQDSLKQIAISKQELFGMLNEAATGQNTSNPTMRKAAEKQVAAIAEKIARLEALEMSYADALAEEKEAVKQTQATPTATMSEEQLEQMDAQYQGILGKTRIQSERVRVMQEYLDKLAEDSVPVVLLTMQNYEERMKADGVRNSLINAVKKQVDAGKTVAGFMAAGKVYLMHEGLTSIEDGRVTYVHERQHAFNRANPQLVQRVADALGNEEAALAILKTFVNEKALETYKDDDLNALADEIICRSMEIVYSNEEFSVDLQSRGVPSEVISIITEIDNEQRQDQSLSYARRRGRRNSYSDVSGAGSVRQDGRDIEQISEGVLEQEETRPSGSSGGGAQTGEGAEVISDEQLNAPNSGEAQQITAADGEVLADTDGKGGVRFSIRTWNEGGRDYLAAWLANDTILTDDEKADILARMDEFYKNALLYSDTYAPFGTWSDAGVRYDNNGNPLMSVIKANGDYAMNLDFSLVCKKRRPLNRLLRTLVNRNAFATYTLRERELAEINWILQEHGFEVACALCFVDSKRYRVTGVADVFAALYNRLVKSLAPEGVQIAHFNYNENPNVEVVENGLDTMSDDQLNWDRFDRMLSAYKPGSVEHKVAQYLREHPEARKLVDATDFIEAEGFESVKENNPDLLKFYNMKKGTGGPKASFGDVQYLNDILKKEKSFDAEKAYAVGGVRLQSFSDFVPHMYFDYMQLFAELAAKKLPLHAYTKEVLFAKIFGLTGAKINMSLVPAVVEGGIAPGLDAEGNYAWADPVTDAEGNVIQQGQSFPYDEAMAIQQAEGYSKNCGVIAVGISDAHIEKMLDDPNIPFIIPYHKSSLNAIVARMTNIDQYKDYTNVQNTRKASGSKLDKGTKDFNFNEYLHGLGESGTPQQAAQAYLDWCRENNYKPKFSQFAYHPNYYKLLQDFNTVDLATGEYAPQGAVTMTFPTEESAFGNVETLIQQGLQEDAELEEKMEQEIDGIADQVLARLEEISKEPKMSEKQQAKRMAELADERTAKIKAKAKGPIDLIEEAKKAVAREEAKNNVSFRITPEMQQIKEKAEKDGTFMKAPNGKPTNLSKEQWLIVRTENFIKWFGDWENAFKKTFLLNGSPVARLSGNEFSKIAGKTLTEQVGEYYDKIGGKAVSPIYGEVVLDKNGADDSLSHGMGRNKAIAYAAVKEVIENGVVIGTDYNHKGRNYNTAVIAAPILIGNESFICEVVIKRSKKDNTFYVHEVTSTKNLQNAVFVTNSGQNPSAHLGDLAKILQNIVSTSDDVSKVVDENGEPKVVYHQTNQKIYVNRETGENWDELGWKEKMEWDERDDWEDYWEEQDFNTFSRVNARTTNEFDGFFFAPEYDENHEYGDRTIAAFVNIKNPASREDYNIDSRYNDAGRDERIRLQEAGFDGVIRMDGDNVDEYIAFEPNQIKSATDNNGDFNPNNNDIRFRITSEQDAAYLKAVEAGGMDTAQRMVIEAAKLAMPNTKVMDKKGNPAVVYHGTKGKFNTFAYSREDIGFHFGTKGTARTRIGRGKDARIMQVFLNLENPLIFDTDLGSWDADYIVKDLLKKEMMSYDDAKAILLTPNGYKRNSVSALVDLRQWMSNNGYDGIVYPNWYESNGKDSYIAFSRSQIKSADPVTYDDAGNVIPLSERFNPKNADIRFRVLDTTNAELKEKPIKLNGMYRFNLKNAFKGVKDNGGSYPYIKVQLEEVPEDYSGEKITYNGILEGFAVVRVPKGLITEGEKDNVFFIDPKAIENELWDVLRATENYYEYKHGGAPYQRNWLNTEGVRFRMSNENQAIFVSNAAKAVEGIKMEKATPEQWLKMIEKNGGLKAGEDKWMGLSDWLKASDKKTLTKAEVLEFIGEHMIQIEEVHYGANAEDAAAEQHALMEQRVNELYKEILDGLQDIEDYDERRAKAFEKLQEELDEWGDYVDLDTYSVYLTFPYEDLGDYIEMADALGVELNLGNQIHETRLTYTTDGLDNKREIALIVPTIESWNETDSVHFGDAGDGRAVAWIRFGDTVTYNIIDRNEEIEKAKLEYVEYVNNLMQKYNIVGFGMNTLDRKATAEEQETYEAMFGNILELQKEHGKKISANKRVLVIDEIQSKRHQEGREKGYLEKDDSYQQRRAEWHKAKREHDAYLREMDEKYGEWLEDASEEEIRKTLTEEEFNRAIQLINAEDEARKAYQKLSSRIPDAPFDKNWHELAMKRMLRYAAENGYDVIAWTKGEQQAERYNLGKIYNEIEREDNPNIEGRTFSFSGGNYDKVTVNEDGVVVDSTIEEAKGKSLSDLVGKDLAVKMMSLENYDTIDGEDLRIGGEGMKGFYDKMLPAFMNKYGKKWGVKVEDIELPNLENGLTMHSVPVTEEMKASVMEGQVMFRMRGENESAMDFHQSVVDEYKAKYTELGFLMALPVDETTAKRFGYTLEELQEIDGLYEPDTDIIAIFAHERNEDSMEVENTIFHEDIHFIASFYPHMDELGKWLWENTDAIPALKKLRDHIEKKYTEDKRHQEMLCNVVSYMMSAGRTSDFDKLIPYEYQDIVRQIENEIGYDRATEESSRIAEPALRITEREEASPVSVGSNRQGRKSNASESRTLTAEERRIINEYFPGAFRVVDSNGNTLTPAQEKFFVNSKAVDKDGNLLVLYHGTPRAGFTEFKSGWFTTSKEDAISYSGDRKGRLFDPNEKYEPETLTAGDFRLGYMTFDSEEDRAAFLERFPYADEVMSEREYEDARMEAEDEEYDALTERRKEFAEVWNAYREYERERFVDTTIGDLIANPEAYTEEDLMRAMLEYDSNASLDSLDDMDAAERKDALVSALQNANEETDGGIFDMVVPTRVPRNGEGLKHNDLGNRTYEVYANVENPYEIDAKGRGSEFESGDIYKAVEEALADDQYDGVIIRNWRVGRHQQLGDVVVPKNGSQIKLTFNENPTESSDIRFRSVEIIPEVREEMKTIKEQAEKDGTFMNAPNGADTNLTPEQWAMVRTKNFINWAGDWINDPENASVILDEETGEPRVLHHGTHWNPQVGEERVFKPSEYATESEGQTLIVGYFSADKTYSEVYGPVSQYYIKMAKPLVMPAKDMTIEDWAKWFEEQGISGVKFDSSLTGADEHVIDPLTGGDFEDGKHFIPFELFGVNDYYVGDGNITHAIARAGYDGIKWTEMDADTYMPFSSSQIKSATDNTGEFSKSENVSFRTSLELDEEFGDAWRNQQNEDGRHSTQVANTKSTYEKIGHYLEDAGMKGASILDASSGLGLGTQALREMGFQVDDVEPFPSENREAPTFSSYADIDGKYDVVVSNAVLNVIPDDWRADVLHQMADAVKEGGKMIINTRPASNIAQQGVEGKTRITLDSPSEILVKRGDRIAAYQKGFTSEELAEWIKSELGEGWRVEKATKKNSGISGEGTAVVIKESDDTRFRTIGTPTDEVVTNGLQLTPAQTAEVAANIFAALPEESRKKITEGLNGDILGLKDAILQIPASLASKENWNEEDKRMAAVVRDVLQDLVDANPTTRPLTTKEALWMLYDSTSKVKDLVDAASRAFVAYNLGFDPASMQRKQEVSDYLRFRTASNGAIDAATDMYNYETSLWTERLKESWLDMNQSVKSLQEALAQASGMPVEPWENIVFALNQLSSKSYADKKKYLRDFLMPMWDTILDIVKHDHVSIEEIERYMMLKHGLERNKKFATRDAKDFYRTMYDLVAERMKNQSHAQQVVALSEAKKKLADIDAQIAVASSSQLPRLNEARAKAQYDVDVADLVLRGDEQQNEAELQAYYDAIDNEADPKYREFREKDYGGLTSMFVDITEVQRSKYKSEEAYQKAVLAATTPKFDKVADMEAEAEAEVDAFENRVYMYKALWDKVNAATKETLRHQYESGMITIEQYEAVRDMFEFYVPLRGFADNTAEDMYSYYMNNSAGGFTKPILGAKGRKTRAESPLGWIGTMAESAIQSDNKNQAKMALYYMTLRRPDQNLLTITETWYEYTGQKDANGKKIFKAAYPPATDRALNADELRQHMEDWEDDMKKKQSRGEAYKGSQRVDLKGSVVFQDEKEEKEHVVRVKVAGKDYSILINGNPRAAQAINGLLNPDANVGPVGSWVGELRRGMSSLLTSFSPLFWVANYQRDLLSSFMRTSESEGWGDAFKYLANRRKAWRVASYIYKYENGELGNSYYENLYKEFAENGGITGYTVLTTNKEYEKLLADYAENVDKKFLNAIKGLWDKFMGFGEAIEQVSRFAAYITARESGKSIEEAVNAAKEVSVNFNRKGSANPISMDELDKLRTKNGKKLNAVQKGAAIIFSAMPKGMKELYFFFNASVQALSSSAKLAKKSPGKAATWAGLYFGTSIAMAMINYLLAGDDDEEYLDLPDYLRHSTLLIKVSDDYYFKWSLPQEMRPFYAWADLLVSKAMGKMPHKNLGKEMALVAAQWLPVNPFDAEDFLLGLVPDYASPIAEAMANKTSFGGRIYDDMKFKSEAQREEIPAYRKATEKTGKIYVDLAELLNDISGGDEVVKGGININPSVVEHLVEGYGGGIYDFAKMVVALPGMIASDDPVEIKNIPFVNKVIMSVDETNMNSHINDAFRYYSGIADNAKRVEKEYRESDDPSRADAYREEEDWRIYLLYKEYEKDFKDVKERLDNAVDKDEEDLLKQEQNVLREMFLDDIAKGDVPEVTFQIREDVKRIDKEVKAVMKPVTEANKERLERKKAGDVDGMIKAIERRDSLKETPEYKRAEELNEDLKEIKKQLKELGSVTRGSQRDSVIGELQKNYDALIQKMEQL